VTLKIYKKKKLAIGDLSEEVEKTKGEPTGRPPERKTAEKGETKWACIPAIKEFFETLSCLPD